MHQLRAVAWRIAVVAMIVTGAVLSSHAPALAHGSETAPMSAFRDPGLPAKQALANRMQAELALLPRGDRRGRCVTTRSVAGVGKACKSSNDMFLVQHGSTFVPSHGFDAPAPEAFGSYLSGSSAAVSSADVSDISCVDPTSGPHSVLVYAYPSDAASRYATIAPLLRQEAYKMSAFLNAESQSVDPSKGKRLRLACDSSGVPTVANLQLSHAGSSDSFGTIVNDMASLGYGGTFSIAANDRYIVFYDGSIGGGIAGMGHLYQNDAASSTSSNNSGGLVAVEFNWGGVPHFDTLLHETGHNMGAVQMSAPHTSGSLGDGSAAGHCTDGLDIMCYGDGGSNTYTSTSCAVTVFDCNRNDYFNPTPASGSYLASHWNVAASYNRFLDHVTTVDTMAPTSPANVSVSGTSSTSISLSWDAASDDIGVTRYRIWQINGTTTSQIGYVDSRLTYSITSLSPSTSYTFGVSASDAAGNQSSITTVNAITGSTTDTTPPTAPASAATASVSMTSASLMWAEGSDDVGVTNYRIYKLAPSMQLVRSTHELSTTITGLKPGTGYSYGVASVDAAGQESSMTLVMFTTAQDTIAPTTPRRPSVSSRGRTSIKIAWRAATDNVGVASYRVYMWRNGAWRFVGSTTSTSRKHTQRGLKPGHAYSFRVRARDASGNMSWWSPMRITWTHL